MDCCYLGRNESPKIQSTLPNVSSPEMFDSDSENDNKNIELVNSVPMTTVSPEKPTQAELVVKSDNYLLARLNKFLSGVPPPPKHTICRNDCAEFLLRIYENRHYFWTACPLSDRKLPQDITHKSPDQLKDSISRSNIHQRTRHTPRNLINAFDACDVQQSQSFSNDSTAKVFQAQDTSNNSKVALSIPNENKILDTSDNTTKTETFEPVQLNSKIVESKDKQFPLNLKQRNLIYHTMTEKEASTMAWSEAYHQQFFGIHYNRNRAIEEYENLTLKLCERYIGAETQSTCNVFFSKAPGSARKRSLLAKRENGQSPGKRLNHLTRRRRTFSSANLQGMGLTDKKQLLLNIKKPYIRKGKSPRGKSPRGKSPRGKSQRGKSPRSSTKKKAVRRLTLDGPSPLKSKIETSKRALFQSPTSDRAGPSKLFTNGTNAQSIKRVLFPTPKKREDDSEACKKPQGEESRKRKCEEELEGPRCKWAKSLSFDCPHELHNSVGSWKDERHSSSNIIEKSKSALSHGRGELSDTHRKKLLWAVAEALRSKGIGMSHPRFKQYASNLARTIKKFMPDLENRNIPRKPGSTSDRMLKLAKHHVLFIIDTRPSD